MAKEKLTDKAKELENFKSCLFDFWGEEPTKRAIIQAWKDYVSCLEETYTIPRDWYKLSIAERNELYKVAGIE